MHEQSALMKLQNVSRTKAARCIRKKVLQNVSGSVLEYFREYFSQKNYEV